MYTDCDSVGKWEKTGMDEQKREDAKRQKEIKKIQEAREERKKRRKRQVLIQQIILGVAAIILFIGIGFAMKIFPLSEKAEPDANAGSRSSDSYSVAQPEIDVQLLTINEYSRPGIATSGINGIVIHYTANPGSTAQDNRDYFENLKDSHDTKASSNFIVGLEGEIIQCIPTSEIAYASNDRNSDTVSIETCHPDETGKFTEATYESLVELTAFLCSKFGLGSESVIRHYDVTGKNCPKYFVENEEAWEQFRTDVAAMLE